MADYLRISKTLSYWLRHQPDASALTLDAQGWTQVDDILAALARERLPNDIDTLLALVEQSDKQRFELSPDLQRIRARQGHSVEIDLALTPTAPPETLYHGTVDRFLAAILNEGLQRMRRHHVHLSPDVETAERVGARRGKPVIFAIDAAAMHQDGHAFFVTENSVWLTDAVPALYLRR
ncbi:MAG TPA: RNA 2'-phosphotransferase, partial [Verrucomicrobiae bacterium]|nr:RNA 2'-phosphotransferase [Verrucomicrobiae bacterium]